MPVEIVSGLPGSGKSLTICERLDLESKKTPMRPIYVAGLDDLVDGPWNIIENPLDWQSLPDGSLVIVDEAQKWFPQRRSGPPIPPIAALSEHRHRGFDFMLITQHPSMLDNYVRKLCGLYTHIVRKFNTQVAVRYVWSEVIDNPQSLSMRKRSVAKPWKYPKHLFQMYKSATMHNMKRRVPFKVIIVPFVVLAAVVLGYIAYQRIWHPTIESTVVAKPAESALADRPAATSSGSGSSESRESKPRFKNAAEYAEFHTPRIASLPWSSPAFDQRRVLSDPNVYCVIVENKPCRCYTEQITPYEMEPRNCEAIAKGGVYNPYRKTFAETPRFARVSDHDDGKQNASSDGARSADDSDIPRQQSPRSVVPGNAVRPGVPAGGPQWVQGVPAGR